MMIMTGLPRRIVQRFDDLAVPDTCRRRFISLDARQETALIDSIVRNYYLDRGYDDPRVTLDLAEDFEDAIYGTVNRNRRTVIPWLHSLHPLDGMRVLEIGTGAGGS